MLVALSLYVLVCNYLVINWANLVPEYWLVSWLKPPKFSDLNWPQTSPKTVPILVPETAQHGQFLHGTTGQAAGCPMQGLLSSVLPSCARHNRGACCPVVPSITEQPAAWLCPPQPASQMVALLRAVWTPLLPPLFTTPWQLLRPFLNLKVEFSDPWLKRNRGEKPSSSGQETLDLGTSSVTFNPDLASKILL